MKFEKLFLISFGVIVSIPMSFSLQAKEKLQSVDAFWESASVINTQAQNKKSEQLLVAAVKQKLQRQEAAEKKARKNTQNPVQKNKEDAKLARQRAIWKAKWDAEQKAKKLTAAPQQPAVQRQPAVNTILPSRPLINSNIKLTAAEIALANQQPVWKKDSQSRDLQHKTPQKVVQQRTSKPLTREQYHLRWKQQQLAQVNLASPVLTNADAEKLVSRQVQQKPSYSVFKSNRQHAANKSLPFEVQHKLRAAKLKSHAMSAYVQDVNSNKPLLGHQDTTSRVPASVMKLITSYAALGTLGPDYRWPLDVYTRGAIQNGTLKGDLIIKGYGSPEFNEDELRKVLQGIKDKGIRNVSGRVVFDNSYFNVPNKGSLDGKTQSAYNAQPDALLYNERLNSFQVRAKGKKKSM